MQHGLRSCEHALFDHQGRRLAQSREDVARRLFMRAPSVVDVPLNRAERAELRSLSLGQMLTPLDYCKGARDALDHCPFHGASSLPAAS